MVDDCSYLKSLKKKMITEENWTWYLYIYGELGLETYTDYGLLHCEIIDIVSRVANETIFGRMIDLRNCEKLLYWKMELYNVFTRVVLPM